MVTFTEIMSDPEFQRKVELLQGTKHRYYPVFSGKTEADEKVVLYVHIADNSFHILRPDGELWALSPGATVEDEWNMDREVHYLQVTSPEWSGRAQGTKRELIEEPAR